MMYDIADQLCLEYGLARSHLPERCRDLVDSLILADYPGDAEVDGPGKGQRVGHSRQDEHQGVSVGTPDDACHLQAVLSPRKVKVQQAHIGVMLGNSPNTILGDSGHS